MVTTYCPSSHDTRADKPWETLLGIALTLCILMNLLPSCGYKGEPIPEVKPGTAADTVVNDLSYTAVTGNVSAVSAVAATLNGFANGDNENYKEFGFLVSRYEENPSYEDTQGQQDGRGTVVKVVVEEADEENKIAVRVHGLIPMTTFYYRTFIVRDGETIYGVVKRFQTIDLSIKLLEPTGITIEEAHFAAETQGLGPDDYGEMLTVNFRFQDVSFDSIGATFTTRQYATEDPSTHRLSTHIGGLTPGKQYFCKAFVDVTSPFYVPGDNSIDTETGTFTYGEAEADVATERYKSEEVPFAVTPLTGVMPFPQKEPAVDYDIVDIDDNYFVLPSDTLRATEYGVAFVTTEADGTTTYTHYPSTDDLRTGNRYSVRVTGLQLKADFDFVAYVDVKGLRFYSVDVVHFETKDYTPNVVDLDVSVLWADRNVGSYSPEVAGHYYSWGEIEAKKVYDDMTFTGANEMDLIGGTDYDVAHVKWGGKWRMPTRAEFQELIDECEWEWTQIEGVWGYKVTSFNDQELFFPAGGFRADDLLKDASGGTPPAGGYYWTSERSDREPGWGHIHNFYFLHGPHPTSMYFQKSLPILGFTVRPVMDK